LGTPRTPFVHREAAALEHAAAKIVDDDVGFAEQRFDDRAIMRPVEVGGEPKLVAIDAQVIRAPPFGVEGRSPAPSVVARFRPLDLDDICAKVAKEHGAERTRENAREIENFDPSKHLMSS